MWLLTLTCASGGHSVSSPRVLSWPNDHLAEQGRAWARFQVDLGNPTFGHDWKTVGLLTTP